MTRIYFKVLTNPSSFLREKLKLNRSIFIDAFFCMRMHCVAFLVCHVVADLFTFFNNNYESSHEHFTTITLN